MVMSFNDLAGLQKLVEEQASTPRTPNQPNRSFQPPGTIAVRVGTGHTNDGSIDGTVLAAINTYYRPIRQTADSVVTTDFVPSVENFRSYLGRNYATFAGISEIRLAERKNTYRVTNADGQSVDRTSRILAMENGEMSKAISLVAANWSMNQDDAMTREEINALVNPASESMYDFVHAHNREHGRITLFGCGVMQKTPMAPPELSDVLSDTLVAGIPMSIAFGDECWNLSDYVDNDRLPKIEDLDLKALSGLDLSIKS